MKLRDRIYNSKISVFLDLNFDLNSLVTSNEGTNLVEYIKVAADYNYETVVIGIKSKKSKVVLTALNLGTQISYISLEKLSQNDLNDSFYNNKIVIFDNLFEYILSTDANTTNISKIVNLSSKFISVDTFDKKLIKPKAINKMLSVINNKEFDISVLDEESTKIIDDLIVIVDESNTTSLIDKRYFKRFLNEKQDMSIVENDGTSDNVNSSESYLNNNVNNELIAQISGFNSKLEALEK